MSQAYPLAPGAAERLLKVIARLKLFPAGISCIELIDPASAFSKLWRDVFTHLTRKGTEVRQKTPRHAEASGDLRNAQKALLGENLGRVKGDGSLLKIEAKTLMEAERQRPPASPLF